MADVTLTHPDHDGTLTLDSEADFRRIRVLGRQGWTTGTVDEAKTRHPTGHPANPDPDTPVSDTAPEG